MIPESAFTIPESVFTMDRNQCSGWTGIRTLLTSCFKVALIPLDSPQPRYYSRLPVPEAISMRFFWSLLHLCCQPPQKITGTPAIQAFRTLVN